MTKQQVKKQIQKLRKEIERHRHLYYVLDKPEISDAAWDSLNKELEKLERQHPELAGKNLVTERVGGRPLDKFVKVTHSRPILSLQDVFSVGEVIEWEARNQKLLGQKIDEFYCELKLDGLTVVLTYQDGKFVRGATRGDGRVGEDVTNNLKTIKSIPLELDLKKFKNPPAVIEVRGEVVMSNTVFNALNKSQSQSGADLYANPRNTAAGTIRQLDPRIVAERNLDCFAFELITDMGQKTHAQAHQYLKTLGFQISQYDQLATTMTEVEKFLSKWETKRKSWDFNTDGAVIIVNDIIKEKKLGSVGKSERWMVAYKFPAEQATTKVQDIIVQVGRTGALTPIAVLSPVRVAGSTVARATLHNEDEIERLDVRIGDTVIIQKAGDIIPDIVEVLPKLRTGKEKKFIFPKKCPICGSAVERKSGEVAHYCTNKQCWAREIQQLIHFVSKKAFNIEGLGDKIVEQLVAVGLVSSPVDFFKLTIADLQPLERFADKSADNLIKSIAKHQEITLAKFIYALGIRHVGEQTAVDLAQHFGSLEALKKVTIADLEEVPEVGSVIAESIVEWFKQSHNLHLLQSLADNGVKIINPSIKKNTKITGKVFVITGTLSQARSFFEDQVRAAGGKISNSVSAKTDYLLAGDNPGSKYAKAQKLGVAIITEAEWKKIID